MAMGADSTAWPRGLARLRRRVRGAFKYVPEATCQARPDELLRWSCTARPLLAAVPQAGLARPIPCHLAESRGRSERGHDTVRPRLWPDIRCGHSNRLVKSRYPLNSVAAVAMWPWPPFNNYTEAT